MLEGKVIGNVDIFYEVFEEDILLVFSLNVLLGNELDVVLGEFIIINVVVLDNVIVMIMEDGIELVFFFDVIDIIYELRVLEEGNYNVFIIVINGSIILLELFFYIVIYCVEVIEFVNLVVIVVEGVMVLMLVNSYIELDLIIFVDGVLVVFVFDVMSISIDFMVVIESGV